MKKITVLTGAGISAESGLQTFRDAKDGLWEGYNVEDVATPQAWAENPKRVLDFYNWRRSEALKAKPNKAHIFLAEAEQKYDISIITQNVDNLHERAGSSKVLHLHGDLCTMRSESDPSLKYHIEGDIKLGDLAEDGAQLRPDIVWFGEAVPNMYKAIHYVQDTDALVVIGTSLVVYPAASLIHYISESDLYVLDKNIPQGLSEKVVTIEKKATEGISELFELLD